LNQINKINFLVLFLNNYDKVTKAHTDPIKFVLCGAAPFGKSDMEKFLKKAPQCTFVPAYGLTEASPVTHMVYPESKYRYSAGFPMPDTICKIVKVDDPDCKALGANEMGELLVKGPQVMKGYHNNEKATKETITPDGWLRTGDIGYLTENNEVYIADRLKELIKVKGYQVPPAELEEILRTHPDVLDSAVIGIPNSSSGELPRAFIVTKNKSLTEKEVKDYVAGKVAEYKRLEGGVEFVDQIPKNASGKILRRELKKLFT
jgi:acyl-CoA synthetase (AMP-forming)/AMP-acid ligase II